MDEERRDQELEPTEAEPQEREVDPADDPGPRGNPEIDEGRLERDEEDLDRTIAS